MSKRAFAISAATVSLILAAGAGAQTGATKPWNGDSTNRLTFNVPASWPVDKSSNSSAEVTQYIAGVADAECNFYVVDRPATANDNPEAWLRTNKNALTAEKWGEILKPFHIFKKGATVDSASMDSEHFWPRQKAVVSTPDGKVISAITTRPGLEIFTFCLSFDGKDRAPLFDAVINSVATPKDASLQAAVEAGAAARAAKQAENQATAQANAKAAEAAAKPKEAEKKRNKGSRGAARGD
jgi:hypothetical protein